MIVYDVKCSKGYVFTEWFNSSADFDAKSKAGDIACPECGDSKIGKALMAPNVATGGGCGTGSGGLRRPGLRSRHVSFFRQVTAPTARRVPAQRRPSGIDQPDSFSFKAFAMSSPDMEWGKWPMNFPSVFIR